MAKRELPHDLGIERAILGAILRQPTLAFTAAALPLTAFYSTKHRVVFRAIAETVVLHGTVDLLLVANQLRDSERIDDAGGLAYVAGLHDGSWLGVNLPHYVKILNELALRRDAIIGAEAAAETAKTEGVDAVRAAFATLSRRLDSAAVEHPFQSLDLQAVARGETPEVPWIVEGWLGKGDATLFGGEWGTGKSLLALDLALAVASGTPWLGRLAVPAALPVLYLDEENNPVNAHRRLSRMLFGRDLIQEAPNLPLTYGTKNRIKLDLAAGRATVERLIGEKGIAVIVLDSFIRFGQINVNKNDELARFFDEAIAPLIGRYGISVVMLDHMRKPNSDDDKTDIAHRITGGSDKSGFADNVWVIHGKRDETSRTFEARKNRWEDTLPPPLTTNWEVSEDETSARITATDAALNAEAVILGALLDNSPVGLFATELFELAERRSVAKRTAIRTIKRLVRRGAATKMDLPGKRVRYSLA